MLKRPVVKSVFVGDKIILRIDDADNPEFWCTLEFSPMEWRNLTLGFMQFLDHSGKDAALAVLRDSLC